jgi:hypothetical protein
MEGFLETLAQDMSVYLKDGHNEHICDIVSSQFESIDSHFDTEQTLCMFEVQNETDGTKKCNISFSEAFGDLVDHYGVFDKEIGEKIDIFKCDKIYDSTYNLGIVKSTCMWLIPQNIQSPYQTKKTGIIYPAHESDTHESWNYIYNVFLIMSKYNTKIREYNGQLYYIVVDSSIVGARKQFVDFVNTFVKVSKEIDNELYLSMTDHSYEVPYSYDTNYIGNRMKYFIVNVPAFITTETIHIGQIKQHYRTQEPHVHVHFDGHEHGHVHQNGHGHGHIGWKTSCQHCYQNNTIPHFVIKDPKQHKQHLICSGCSKQMINYAKCTTHNIYYYKSNNKQYNVCPKYK